MRTRWARIGGAVVAMGLAGAWCGITPLPAQAYFGKNQVQFRHFDWQVLETDHFLIHYYPSERTAAVDAARMAERAYNRLSRILAHEFREKKPIMVFASRADFGQNNVTGDLGEGTGGVTEPLRDRMLLFFTGDYRSFEHVLTHEMVHEFQFDVFQRGRGAGGAISSLTQINPPLWFMEGMAEYLSIGPDDPQTATIIRDAALNGHLPTIRQMTERPDLFFPYRYGEAFWAYIGERWGDETVGAILANTPSMGVEHAFKRETGRSLDDLGDEWREAMQVKHLPQIAQLERPRRFAQPLLTERRSGGQVFLAPALSPDGKYIAFLSNGSFLRGQVFIDLWLGDARTGKRLARLVKSTFDPNYEELQLIYSQSAFSPDSKRLAFTALGEGTEYLYVLDVERRKRIAQIKLPLDGVTGPSWSPDGRRIVFSGNHGGITDLYMVNADGTDFRQLTNDKYGDIQPQWSPDGSTIAFATDRGDGADLDLLRFPKLRIALYHVGDGTIDVLPGQAGLNINPAWAPDSRSIAYVSDRTGIQNLFLYDLATREHYQLTHVVGGVLALTGVSPAITWARGTDRLAFTYYESGDYAVWAVDKPRLLAREPFRAAPAAQIAQHQPPADRTTTATTTGTATDTTSTGEATAAPASGDSASTAAPGSGSFYRTAAGFRPSSEPPGSEEAAAAQAPLSVAALLDSGELALPDTTRFKKYAYHIRFSPDYVARPTVGYARDNFGNGVFGGTAIVLSDMVGNNQLAFAGAINGRISEAQVFAGYTNLSRRFQYTTGIFQAPYYFGNGYSLIPTNDGKYTETQVITRYIQREAYGTAIYPFNRFRRAEVGLNYVNLERTDLVFTRTLDQSLTLATPYDEDQQSSRTVNFVQPSVAYVFDNVLWGLTAPIYGQRYRFQVTPTVGNYRWMGYLADYRRYDPILFNYLTVATRVTADVSVGRDADTLRKYLGYSDILPGYERNTFISNEQNCTDTSPSGLWRCSPLLGSRLVYAGAELRFPLLRGGTIGGVIPLPPIEGAIFYDVGAAWFTGQRMVWHRMRVTDPANVRGLLTSHGYSLRVNLFNYVILRWDYAIPSEAPNKHGYWQFSLYPPF
ncbi:MAG: PD40 domain-containing protein [Gemmatimonadaceae bacterium]|nr:PD40 domain-containing protein [Gemmatimonadaceae bacterium]